MVSEVVYTRDESSGRIHKLIRDAGGDRGYEADNLDDAGVRRVISAVELAAADASDLCSRCFPTTNEPT